MEMIKLAPPAGARQAGYTIARRVIAHALDYDAGVLLCSMLLPHASAINDAVVHILAATMDQEPHQLVSSATTTAELADALQWRAFGIPLNPPRPSPC